MGTFSVPDFSVSFMAHISTAFCRRLAQARREKEMTQSALAQRVGCKQSAISMLESGQAEKVSKETVEKIAKLLDVPLEASSASASAAQPPLSGASGYCPSAACPSNVPYTVQGELFFWPRLQPLSAGARCVFCGELLEARCPQCGAPVTDGACCPQCGAARVTNTVGTDSVPDAWAERRRREIADWKSLLS